ncbi:MAG: hypothetical protein IPM24_07575 [Bryobacterales bacterium]|nr:hypothetical protein [Bryobacterales bacterium]
MMHRCVWALILCAGALSAQNQALLQRKDAAVLYQRCLNLVESTSAAVPGLVRAGAPVVENVRQSLKMLEASPREDGRLTYDLLRNLRAYLALAESVPKPYPFPEEARKQFAELRDSIDRADSHFAALLETKEGQLVTADRDNLARYAEANARIGPPSPNQPRVVFLGDSITDGWRLNEYFPGRDFVNRGIGGQITGQMLGRMLADVVALKPAAVVILAGTNDIGRGAPVKAIQDNLTMIADLADKYKIRVMMASILPVSDYHRGNDPRYERTGQRPPATILEMNRWIQQLCQSRRYVYIDYFSAMVDDAGFLKKEHADDGLHPNSLGYRVMAPIVLTAIDKQFAPAPQQEQQRRRRLGVF